MNDRNQKSNSGSGSPPTRDEILLAEGWSEQIDLAARGKLGAGELDALETAARHDSALREALEDARAMRPVFERAARLHAPASLETRILGAIDADTVSRTQPGARPRSTAPRFLHAIPAWGWTVAAAAAVVLLVWTGPFARFGTDRPVTHRGTPTTLAHNPGAYTESEVRAAARDMETALAMLNQSMDRSSALLRGEVSANVRRFLGDGIRQGFGRTIDKIPYLNTTIQNEEHSGISIPPRDDAHRTLGGALPGKRT